MAASAIAPDPAIRTSRPASNTRIPLEAWIAGGLLVLIGLAATAPGLLAAAGPLEANPLEAFQPPGPEHVFGTDHLGRDVYARVVHGAGSSLFIGLTATAIAVIVGSLLGLLAALTRGLVDEAMSRFFDVLGSFPDLLLALFLISFTGPGTWNLILALSVAAVPRFARVVRGQAFVVAQSGFVEQARTFGISPLTLVWRHILPHAVATIPILATIGLGTTIISAAALSFLGMGPQPPAPEWGAMLSEGRNYLRNAWWVSVFPGLLVALTVISVTILGRYWQQLFEGRTAK